MAAIATGRLDRLDRPARDARLDEDRLHAALDDPVDDPVDVLETGFGQGADPLDPDDLHPVALAEVAERVVRGDEHALVVRQGGDLTLDPGVELEQLGAQRLGVGAQRLGVLGQQGGELGGDRVERHRPQADVEPDVRIVLTEELGRLAQPVLRNRLADGGDRP